MKSTLLTLFSAVVMITSCKCNKAATDVAVSPETAVPETKVVEEVKTVPVISSESEVQKQENGTMVEYEANTRGYFLHLKYANNQLGFTNERGNETLTKVTLTKEQQDELNALLASIKVESLSELKDPTQKRFYDGAAIAHLKITSGGKEFNTVDFDHGFPPVEIEKLVKKLVSYTEQK